MPITIADDVFGSGPGGDDANEAVLLTAEDTEAARRALERAVERFWRVNGLGVEHADDDEIDLGIEGPAGHSCKYDSGVFEADGGLQVWLDCQKVIPPAMGRAYVRILREELERAGVHDAVVTVPPRHPDAEDDVVRTRDHDRGDHGVDAIAEPPPWVRRYPAQAGLPLGFPPDVALPPHALVLGTRAQLRYSTTLLTYHDGSWGAELVLAVDDLDAAFAHFAEGLPARGYVLSDRVVQQREEGEAIGMGFMGHGVEIEVAGVAAAVAAKVDPDFRALPGKDAVVVIAYQRRPGAEPAT